MPFAAIRKEAYIRLPRRTVMAQQYRGSAVGIVYSTESLREIFVNNIRLVKDIPPKQVARAKPALEADHQALSDRGSGHRTFLQLAPRGDSR